LIGLSSSSPTVAAIELYAVEAGEVALAAQRRFKLVKGKELMTVLDIASPAIRAPS